MVDLLDKVAFFGRRYERQVSVRSHSSRFGLEEVLSLFDRKTILELTPVIDGRAQATVRPDMERKLKVSLLDNGISALHSHTEDWFEVYRTAPSGDLEKVRIVGFSPDNRKTGELAIFVSQRSPAVYFGEDPILQHIEQA